MGVKRIRFLSKGFQGVLTSPGVEGVVHATAREQAAALEASEKVPYKVRRMAGATSRAVYIAEPEGEEERVKDLDHETWVNEVWPMVGGPKWRPHR